MNSNSSMDDNDQTPSSNDMKSQNGHTSCNSSPKMSAEERFQKLISIGQECTKEDELSKLLTKKPQPICYDGFEPSGRMHIAQGVMKVINVKKMTSAGCKVKIWIADWFAHLNLKMGGDLNNIQTAGKYFIEIWKAFGMVEGGVEFLWASEEINSRLSEYLPLVFDIARKSNLLRIKRCCQIMGRNEEDELMGSQILYPCMQCADIFFLEADICQMGMDQRKVNMLAREYCDDIKRKNKPIILSHHMLPGLQQGQEKMSKSNPLSSIFMEDGEEEVNEKIKKAYCPPPQKTAEGNPCLEETVKGNPCLQYIKYLIFPWFNEFTVDHSIENGGNKTYKNFKELVTDYAEEKLLSADLKPALSNSLNKILQPVRDRFNSDTNAKDLLERVKELLQRSNSAMEGDVQIPPSNNMNTRPINSRNGHTSSSSSPKMSAEETRERFRIVRGVGEECKYEDELWKLLAENPEPICYDGFEPSGRMHIAEGIMKVINVGKLTSAGCKVKIWIADWFALLNIKKGGDLNKIQTIGRYFIEICKAFGMDEEGVEFLWASEEIKSRSSEYLPLVFDIAKRTSLTRLKRCSTIMGREEDELTGGHIWYICMQCADVFFLKADICQTGMDQREVNELAREYCDDIKKKNKPIFLPHHILPGLQQGQEKMSKSDPSSCIYMDDEEAEVNRKIKKKAYCPPKIVEGNTCLAYVKYLVFPWFDEFEVELSTTNGGNKIYKTFEELVFDYEDEKLLPADLKTALSKALNKILQPVREHFNKDADLKNLLKEVKGIKM